MRAIEKNPLPSSQREFNHTFRRPARPTRFRWAPEAILDVWKPAHLKARFGDAQVPILVSEDLTGELYQPIVEQYESRRLGAYIDDITEGEETGYLAQYRIFEHFPELGQLTPFPHLYGRFHRTNLFFGPAGSWSKLHYDMDENLFWQLSGRKHVVIAPPEDRTAFEPTNEWWGDGYSPLDLRIPGALEALSDRGVSFQEATLEAGDMLYIPAGWWHAFSALDVSVSLARIWWPPPLLLRCLVRREWGRVRSVLTGNRAGTTYGPALPEDVEGGGQRSIL